MSGLSVGIGTITNAITSNLSEILAAIAFISFVSWLWIQYQYSYWKRHKMPHINPSPIFGNFKDLLTSKIGPCEFFEYLYNHDVAKNQPAMGMYLFNKPCILVRDLELVKSVLIKDFNTFSNRHSASDPHSDSLGSDNLFFTKNPKWKEIRVKLTPVFTSGKIKQMFPLIDEIGNEFDKYLCNLKMDPTTNSTVIEVKDINALFTTDVIAIVAYGIRANSLRNPSGDFRTNGKRIFHFTLRRALEFKAMFFLPSLVRLCGVKVFSKETTNFLRNTINYVMEERIKTGAERNDLIDILINFRRQAEAELKEGKKPFILERDCLAAQAAIFFSAGFETSSGTMSFALFELARHQEVQKRLREEIREALQSNNGKLSYDMIMGMKYLDNVIKEVLRFYPPLPFLDRECTLKQGVDGYSLAPFGLDYSIPDGMPVYVPISAIQKDPKYFENPEEFDPDRFLPENKDRNNINAYLSFGTGPHNCIGERFGLLQTKVGLINFYKNHYVTTCDKSHPKMQLDPRAIIIQSKGGIYCNVVRDPLF